MIRDPEVLILGAGPAGLAAAVALAERRRAVLVLDGDPGRTRPRFGESLDWETPLLLRRLGIEPEALLAARHATRKEGAVASWAPTGERFVVGFHPLYRMLMALAGRLHPTLHLDRAALDEALFGRARDLGVTFLGARVSAVALGHDRVAHVVLECGRVLTAPFVVDAAGQARLVPRAAGIPVTPIGPRKVVLRFRADHGYDGMGTRIRLDDGPGQPAWCWDIHVREDLTDVGVVLTADDWRRRRQGRTVAEVVTDVLARHDDTGWACAALRDEATAIDACSFQDQVSARCHGANWLAVGESAAVLDPLLSSGVTFALRTGLAAAELVDAGLRDPTTFARRAPAYTRKVTAQATTANLLIDGAWYRSRLRHVWGLWANVLLILVVNFNLNHLHARRWAQTRPGVALLSLLHAGIDRALPLLQSALLALGRLAGRASHHGGNVHESGDLARPASASGPLA